MTLIKLKRMVCLGALTALCSFTLPSSLTKISADTQAQSQTSPVNPPAAQKNQYIIELEKQIAGREEKPAEEVFKNIQLFKGMPALRVLRIMSVAFSAALGVDCTHCHVPGEWEKEDKQQKETARKMWRMMNRLNHDLKETIGKGTVNCTTCHRGQITPALSLPQSK
jgi:hypothetical protein